MNTLRSVDNLANSSLNELLSSNFIMFLDWGLVDKGGFASVRLSDSNINSADRSKLRVSNDPNYSTGKVWEAFHQNMVWESGVSIANQPICVSGVYVNGTFHPISSSGRYACDVDYNNSRVIFQSGLPVTSDVRMEYSYKTYSVIEAKDYPILREIQFRAFDPYNIGFNQTGSGTFNKSPHNRVSLPLIGVEITPKQVLEPHEMGNSAFRIYTDIILHIMAETDNPVKKMVSILSRQKENTVCLLDVDMMAKSGAFPLKYDGTLNSNPKTYPQLINDYSYKHTNAYIIESHGENGNWVSNNLYHGSVTLTVETIL